MPALNQSGAPKQCVFTDPGMTIVDFDSMKCTGITWEKHSRPSGSGRDPSITLGNRKFELEIKTTDFSVLSTLCDGMIVKGVVSEWEAPITGALPDGTVTQSEDVFGWTCSCMMVDGEIGEDGSADKKANVFNVKLIACKDPETGLDATITPNFPGA
jgi:hypothetical protein